MYLRSIIALFTVLSGLVAAWWVPSVAQAGETVTPKVKEVQAKPVLGVYGPVTIDYVTGEITPGKMQIGDNSSLSHSYFYVNTGGLPIGLAAGLDPSGDDLVGEVLPLEEANLLLAMSFSVFNASSVDLNSVNLTVNFLDYDLNYVGSWSIDLDMIALIGGPLPAGFVVLLEVRRLPNINVPPFVIVELAFSNPDPPAVTDIGQLGAWPTSVGWSSGAVYFGEGKWYVGGPPSFYMVIETVTVYCLQLNECTCERLLYRGLLYTTGGPQLVNVDGSNKIVGFDSGIDPNGRNVWCAIPFRLNHRATICDITAYWVGKRGAEADRVRYIVWKRTGLNKPVDGDQVAQGIAGAFTLEGNGPGRWFRWYKLQKEIKLNAGDYWLTLYADGDPTPNWLAWLTGGDKADESLERDGMWRSEDFPHPGFQNFAPSNVQPGPYMTDGEDRWNLCFALWGTTEGGGGGCLERGDCNQDGVINLSDLATLLGCFNAGACCDTNGDNNTNLSDLATLLANFNTNCP